MRENVLSKNREKIHDVKNCLISQAYGLKMLLEDEFGTLSKEQRKAFEDALEITEKLKTCALNLLEKSV